MGSRTRHLDHRRGHPHHLMLDDSRLAGLRRGLNRVNPPLREASDAEACAARWPMVSSTVCGHRPRPTRRAGEVLRVLGGPAGNAWPADRAVRGGGHGGGAGPAGLARVARVMSENPARIVGLDDQGRPLEVG